MNSKDDFNQSVKDAEKEKIYEQATEKLEEKKKEEIDKDSKENSQPKLTYKPTWARGKQDKNGLKYEAVRRVYERDKPQIDKDRDSQLEKLDKHRKSGLVEKGDATKDFKAKTRPSHSNDLSKGRNTDFER